jgi:putative endonuclease
MADNKSKGQHYESLASDYLKEQGLKLLNRNFQCRFGEIDLIMMQREVLCFIEVKYRNSMGYGGAASAIPVQKQKKIVKTAQIFIAENNRLKQHAMRFDALLMQQQKGDQNISIDWIQNAFYAE